MKDMIPRYLDLMDSQRESAFTGLHGIAEDQLWQRSAPKEWGISEILAHTQLVSESFLSLAAWLWKWSGWYGRLRRTRPYNMEIDDLFRSPRFPHWVGWYNLILASRIGIHHDQLHYEDVLKLAAQFRK